MSLGDVLRVEVIIVVAVILLIGTIIPGVRLYWPRRSDPVSRSDLGVALMGGALIAFAVLVLQLMIQYRAEDESRQRQELADHESLLLVLGQSPNLAGLDLEEEDLSEAYLNGKILRNANLADATMTKASLQGADLVAANLADADLTEARLDRADVRYANLRDADLTNASLRGTRFDAATLADVEMRNADLANAWLRADLSNADLREADLIGARLAPANLQGADLREADLEFADLRGANLKGAKLKAADGLSDAKNLDLAKDWSHVQFDAKTTWPDGFEWNGKHPSCKEDPCTLDPAAFPVNDFPPHLRAMRATLTKAVEGARPCLPGWRVGETPVAIVARAPRTDDVSLEIQTWGEAEGSAEEWATKELDYDVDEETYVRAERGPVTFRGVAAFAEHVSPRPNALRKKQELRSTLSVYFIRGAPGGYRMRATASPRLFDIYQRDFLKLFSLLGVKGNLFPHLRGDRDGCPV